MNGSRPDENTISVDGAIAIRTRSAGTIIGVQNVDAIQEVQVLTANYMPEYGRRAAGRSGSSQEREQPLLGSASYFWRDDSLQANTWSRNRSPNAVENGGPAPFDYKQYGWSFGGPVPGEWFKNKLFFFGAQEWVDYFAVATNQATVPTEAMRNGDFSQLLGSNPFFSTPQIIRDPLTGLPFPGNIIPANRLSANGIALMKLYPTPTPGFQSGSRISSSTARTRRTSGRTISGSTTAWATTTRSRGGIRSRTGWPSTPSAGRSRLPERTGIAPIRR